MKILYFTATGNSLSVAKAIGGKLISIPQAVRANRYQFEDDVVGVIFPIYSLNFPKMVRKFLDKAIIKAEYTFIIATCGGFSGKTLPEAQEFAKQNGYHFDYLEVIPMVDNCLPQWEMVKEEEKGKKKNIDGNLARIVKEIGERKVTERIPTPGGSFMCWFSRTFFPVKDDSCKAYIVDDKCIKCGTCAKICPVTNITVTNKVEFGSYCEGCQACIHACPKKAIHLNHERSDARWRNPNVTLSQIIDSNNSKKEIE